MLLERADINPNQAETNDGRAPLSLAAERGYEGVVKMLLERADINPNQETKYGPTPLSLAAEKGNEGVVKMLLEREDLNPNQADTKYGRTPIGLAAAKRHKGVVRTLLERADVNPNQADTKYGRTPVCSAAAKGHEGVVRMLLKRADVNPDQADIEYGRTPLAWAAWCGHSGIVKMLLEREDVSSTTLDNYSQIPLSLALFEGHDEVVKILLGWDNVNSDPVARRSRTFFLPSGVPRNEHAMEMRSNGDDPNIDISDLTGRPALSSPDCDKQEVVWGLDDSVSKSRDRDLSSAELPVSRLSSVGPLKPRRPPKTTGTHPSASQSILSLAVDRRFIISSFICLFAFILYILPSPSLDVFSFRKPLSSERLV